MTKMRFDLCVIGAGPSGYAAAMRALDLKKTVLLIEKNKIGGAGIQNGALSSKTWWELSREVVMQRKNFRRFNMQEPEVNFQEVKNEVLKAIAEKRTLLEEHLEMIHTRYNGLITFISGEAKIVTPNKVVVKNESGDTEYETENIVIATGSRPRMLPEIPVDETIILTSDGIEKLDKFPESMVIIGAGVIGCEYATIFSNFGKTKVNLIDKGDRILPFEDEDVVRIIEKNLEKNGVLIHRNAKLSQLKVENGRVRYTIEYKDGSKEDFNVEKALLSVGRVPNVENIWSKDVKIELDKNGFIVDDDTRTDVPNIYAIGDMTADIALVNIAELEGRHSVEKMFGMNPKPITYANISTIMFLNPEIAGVGLNEQQAREKGMNYRMASVDYSCISRAIAMRNTQGFVKIMVTDTDMDKLRIIGMRVIGEHASSAIQAISLLISMDRGIEELAELIHPHPSITEGIQECVRVMLNKSMLKPSVLRDIIVYKVCKNGEVMDIVF
ncbi:MAG TPA: NAD(P)/FAD-dependent oxidoreductase [Cyclobacteriaceae bacterium]|nr:NAD(P)/FAD-dependent oxidoreductase [Cyclobacteriaceae bacterium]